MQSQVYSPVCGRIQSTQPIARSGTDDTAYIAASVMLRARASIFQKAGDNWTLAVDKLQMLLTYLKKDKFGSSLDLTPDGKFLAAGVPTATFLQKMQGAVYILG